MLNFETTTNVKRVDLHIFTLVLRRKVKRTKIGLGITTVTVGFDGLDVGVAERKKWRSSFNVEYDCVSCALKINQT